MDLEVKLEGVRQLKNELKYTYGSNIYCLVILSVAKNRRDITSRNQHKDTEKSMRKVIDLYMHTIFVNYNFIAKYEKFNSLFCSIF